LFGGYVVSNFGIRQLLMFDAGLSVSIALLLTVALRADRPATTVQESSFRMLIHLAQDIRRSPAIVGIFISYSVLLLGSQMSFPFVPIQVEQVYTGSDLPAAIGLVSAAFAGTSAIFTPLWGRLGDRLGHRRMLLLATIFLIPPLAAQAFVFTVAQLLGVRVVQGVFQAAIGPLAMALLALHSPEDRRASILNLSLFPNYFAWIAGSTLGAALASISLQALFLASAVLLTFSLALAIKLVPRDNHS
jgi:MFS family permease